MNSELRRFQQPAAPRQIDPLDGVLLVDKPAGPTSHDIVAMVRRHFRCPKVGHGGTLDPQATGLLILLLGRATKLSNRFLGSDKTYEGTMRLGVSTDSQDADGNVTREADPSGITEEQVRAETQRFLGDIYQMPPMVSAVKIAGVPLYKHARKGRDIEREARLVHVFEFVVRRFALPDVDVRVKCSKGTYIRTLCADIGENLGCGAHLSSLRRLRSGDLRVEDAAPLEEILKWDIPTLQSRLQPLRRFV